MYDKTSAMQAKAMLKGAGFSTASDLEALAKFKPEMDFEEVFKLLGGELTQKQKEAVIMRIGFQREISDRWYRAETAMGLPVKYKRNYMSKMTGAVKKLYRKALPV